MNAPSNVGKKNKPRRRNHIVPKAYLRGWATKNPNGTEMVSRVRTIHRPDPDSVSLNDLAVQKDFYCLDLPNGKDDGWERELANWESSALHALEGLRTSEPVEPKDYERTTLAAYFAGLYYRGHQGRETVRRIFKQMKAEGEARGAFVAPVSPAGQHPLDVDWVGLIRELSTRSEPSVNMERQLHRLLVIEQSTDLANRLSEWHWVIVRLSSESLLLSDNTLAPMRFQPEETESHVEYGFGPMGADCYFVPVDRKTALLIAPPDSSLALGPEAAFVAQMNQMSIAGAENWIAYHPDDAALFDNISIEFGSKMGPDESQIAQRPSLEEVEEEAVLKTAAERLAAQQPEPFDLDAFLEAHSSDGETDA